MLIPKPIESNTRPFGWLDAIGKAGNPGASALFALSLIAPDAFVYATHRDRELGDVVTFGGERARVVSRDRVYGDVSLGRLDRPVQAPPLAVASPVWLAPRHGISWYGYGRPGLLARLERGSPAFPGTSPVHTVRASNRPGYGTAERGDSSWPILVRVYGAWCLAGLWSSSLVWSSVAWLADRLPCEFAGPRSADLNFDAVLDSSDLDEALARYRSGEWSDDRVVRWVNQFNGGRHRP